MKVSILQPSFLPWLGYFRIIQKSDIVVFLDDVQYSKGSYTNRVQYSLNGEAFWLTVPCKPKFGTDINEVLINGDFWQEQHLNKISSAYRKCPMFDELWPSIQSWLRAETNKKLSDLNIYIIKEICSYLEIKTDFYRSSEIFIGQKLDASDRLVKLVKAVGGNEYFSGLGAKKYQEERVFAEQNLSVTFSSFFEKPRRQNSTYFQRGLSVLDLILNTDPVESRNSIVAKG